MTDTTKRTRDQAALSDTAGAEPQESQPLRKRVKRKRTPAEKALAAGRKLGRAAATLFPDDDLVVFGPLFIKQYANVIRLLAGEVTPHPLPLDERSQISDFYDHWIPKLAGHKELYDTAVKMQDAWNLLRQWGTTPFLSMELGATMENKLYIAWRSATLCAEVAYTLPGYLQRLIREALAECRFSFEELLQFDVPPSSDLHEYPVLHKLFTFTKLKTTTPFLHALAWIGADPTKLVSFATLVARWEWGFKEKLPLGEAARFIIESWAATPGERAAGFRLALDKTSLRIRTLLDWLVEEAPKPEPEPEPPAAPPAPAPAPAKPATRPVIRDKITYKSLARILTPRSHS